MSVEDPPQKWLSRPSGPLHQPPRPIQVRYESRWGKLVAILARDADLAVLLRIENLVTSEFHGTSTRVHAGLLAFSRHIEIGGTPLLLFAGPDGTRLQARTALPAFLSRTTRAANQLVRKLAEHLASGD